MSCIVCMCAGLDGGQTPKTQHLQGEHSVPEKNLLIQSRARALSGGQAFPEIRLLPSGWSCNGRMSVGEDLAILSQRYRVESGE